MELKDIKNWIPFIALLTILVLAWGFILYVKLNNKRLYKNKADITKWDNVCPDYWTNTGNGCLNTFKIGQNSEGQVCNEKIPKNFAGYKEDKDKCIWAKGCNVPWEGVDQSCV